MCRRGVDDRARSFNRPQAQTQICIVADYTPCGFGARHRVKHHVACGYRDRLTDAGDMQNLRGFNETLWQIMRRDKARSRARAVIAEFMPVRSVGDKIESRPLPRDKLHRFAANAFFVPQIKKLPPEGVITEMGEIGRAGTLPRRSDDRV